jgi:membrane protease YdiL (CAAX protease family)
MGEPCPASDSATESQLTNRFPIHREVIPRLHLLVLAVLFEGGLGLAACGLGLWFGLEPWATFQFSMVRLGQGLVVALPMLAVFVCCIRWTCGPLASIKKTVDELVRPIFQSSTIADLAMISTIAGLGEELLFRGFLQTFLEQYLESWPALVLASVLFGLAHPLTATYVVLASAAGLYLGWVFLAWQNLFIVAMAHAVYDFAALLYITRVGNRVESRETGDIVETPESGGQEK